MLYRLSFLLLVTLLLAGCDGAVPTEERPPPYDPGKSDWIGVGPQIEPLNTTAGDWILYELQTRSANACTSDSGGQVCDEADWPDFEYFGAGCAELAELQSIRKSTLDDLLRTSASPHRSEGLTLQYIDEIVGANAVWLMPLFPHNYEYDLPDACDDLGSPYAVRDYLHTRGSLSAACVRQGRDEWSRTPCWGDDALRAVIAAAHARGQKVLLDLAFNHFGHEYQYYDTLDAVPVRDWLERGVDLWDYAATYDPALLQPELLDRPEELPAEASLMLSGLCGSQPSGQEAVRRWAMWRVAFNHERALMNCGTPASLEWQVPGFYLGRDGTNPSRGAGDNYTNDWRDVKFLYHNEGNTTYGWEFARTREYVFRAVNYYLSLGVDGFRMDHANGLTENEWRYIFHKAEFYQARRGLPDPVFLSESFYDILSLNHVFDAMTEGYHHDICYGIRDTAYIENKLFEGRKTYLGDLSYVLLHLENHDEGRLLRAETGFDLARGLSFYAIAAASRGMLMLLNGQEWGEPGGLAFRRSDMLRGRFPGEANWNPDGDEWTARYRAIHQARMAWENRALRQGQFYFLRTDEGGIEPQLFAMARFMPDCTNTVFAFHRLWTDWEESTYSVSPDLAERICLDDAGRYLLVDVFTGQNVWAASHPEGRLGEHIRTFGIFVRLDDPELPFQWLRLERLDF
ncbi:MAG: hypothetical protein JRF33_18390 [Deltaproteobacteria bacterium]|nr:hypothetical protein [Deltaproteobacteria bacterium]